MYPQHLNYTTTLSCKTMTVKITVFIIMLVLKSKENIACYQFRALRKQFISRRVQIVRPQLWHKLEVFDEAQHDFVDRVLWQTTPYWLQDFLQLVDGIWLGLKCFVAFKHSSPDMTVKRVEVWWVWWPFIFSDEVTAVDINLVLSQLCHVSSRCVLVECKTTWQTILAIFNQFG